MNRTILSVVGSLCRHFLPEGAIHSAKGEILQNSFTAYIYILMKAPQVLMPRWRCQSYIT